MEAWRPLLTPAFFAWGSPVTWLEIVAFALAVWMVVCNMRVNPLAWPLAIASSLLYGVLFADSRLYGEAGLRSTHEAEHTGPTGRVVAAHALEHSRAVVEPVAEHVDGGILPCNQAPIHPHPVDCRDH